ncbi:MAG: HAMP domain-containing histidine kinase [Cyanobacteria bacterium M_surface_10_m2_179]|nr:HAMP domain-containing histidine kinase [Cyanobacteria bacterium M_surface_10_m2_179]
MNSSSVLALLLGAGVGGSAVAWLGQSRVTLRRRRKPRPLEPTEQQLRQWIEAVPQGWLLVNADNRIASLNPRAELLLELDDSGLSLRGEPLAVVEPSDELQHLVDLARNTGFSQRGIWPLRSSNLDVRVMPGGEGWVAIVMQGRNPLESQLEQQEQWVSDVAHELKTPLTALRLVGDSLALKAEGRQAVLVERLQRELQRLQQLVADLLELSRLDNTPFNDAASQPAVDPLDVLQAVWNTLEPLAAERGIRLQIEAAATPPQRGAAIEAARLHQALFNLLDNALRYSPDQACIEVGVQARNRWCVLSVRDHGPGLSDVDQERMFQRFYRGDPSRTRSARSMSSSGLGLAIVQQIALSQGGLVRAGNHPQGGAVLELLVPRAA